MKKQFFLTTAVALGVALSPLAGYSAATPKQQDQNMQMGKSSPMSQDEQQFCVKLSALHKQIFMMVFTPAMRQEAMGMMTETSDDDMDDDENMPMTADMAVEQTIMNHRDVAGSATSVPVKSFTKK